MSWTLRPGGIDDLGAIVRLNQESFHGYRAFAPPGWQPTPPAEEANWVRQRLDHPDVWCRVAETPEGALAGHVAFMPADLARQPSNEPDLAHLWMLFVRRSHWGTGLARELHAEALNEATARGFSSMRLFTPAGQLRARRFYEREGWVAVGEAVHDEDFGMPVIEYRRRLGR